MDPAVKTAMAFCVLLAGVCAALLFGRDPARPGKPPAATAEKLLIPGKKGTGIFSGVRRRSTSDRRRSPREAGRIPPAESDRTSPTMLTPDEQPKAPPPLAETYPRDERPANSGWGRSMDTLLPLPTPADPTARTHRIVDGDSLAALAERYLGSASRAGEIFRANRDVLLDPQLLPIGVELKIPPK